MLGRRLFTVALVAVVFVGCGFTGRRGDWKDVSEPEMPGALLSDGSTKVLYDELFIYKVGNGDGLRLSVAGHEEFGGAVSVDQRGRMAIPNTTNIIEVAELSLNEIEGLVADSIAAFVVGRPDVRVSLASSTSKHYYMLGGVGYQSIYPLGAKILRLREVLAIAGFFREYQADEKRVGIITPDPVQPTYLIANGRQILMGDDKYNVVIKPGDIIFVQNSIIYDIDRFLYRLFIQTENTATTHSAVKFWEDAKNGDFGNFAAPQRGLTIIY